MYSQNSSIKLLTKNHYLIDEAWDLFSDYIGEHKLQTPLDVDQFESIFLHINKNGKFNDMKTDILKSFRFDSYLWPMVKR